MWEKLGNLYWSKSLENKLFLRNKLYHLKMEYDEYLIEHIYSFNTLVSQFISIDIMCIILEYLQRGSRFAKERNKLVASLNTKKNKRE